MRLYLHRVSVLLLLSACFCGTARPDVSTPSQTDWQNFRKAYPYHIQGIALGAPMDGCQTLIVAEPPPGVTLEGLQRIDPDVFGSPAVMKQRIGYDGWVKDVVVSLPVRTPQDLRQLTDRLSIYLFGTAYKSYVIPIAQDPVIEKPKLNIHVTATDLNKWLFTAREQFARSAGAAPATLPDVLNAGHSGLYYSESPGLVALVVPRRSPLSSMRRELRRFALDSDLVLGATASATHVAIVARERVQPVELLPPLRTETILLLANTKTDKLSQSYERTNLFAGRVPQIDEDWAPIYLSDDLIDTEYGSLLNITDQMLKSWSSDGMVRYTNFNYEDPQSWPFTKPILIDAGLKEVTFNWNTKGAGYTLDMNAHHILALNRTGSLPVSYIPGEIDETGKNPLQRYEETGYQYFSSRQDPNLVRVVQYAALYQIFREYGIQDDSMPTPRYAHPEWTVLSQVTEKLLHALLKSDADLLTTDPTDNPALAALKARYRSEALRLKSEVKVELQNYGAQLWDDIALRIANPRVDEPWREALSNGSRTYESLSKAEVRRLVAQRIANDFSQTQMAQHFGAEIGGSSRLALYSSYAGEAAVRPSVWIHTPSVVLSRAHGLLARTTGGHNLDAKVVRFRVSQTVPKGDVRVLGEGADRIVLVSPLDADKIPELLRTTALAPSKTALTSSLKPILLKAAEIPSNLPRAQVLAFEPSDTVVRGLSAPQAHAPVLGGWESEKPALLLPSNPARETAKLGTRSITVEKTPDFTFAVRISESDAVITAGSYDAAVDAVISAMKNPDGPAGAWTLDLRGFDGTDARNFVRTTEVQFVAKERLQLAGFATRDTTSPKAVFTELAQHYDFQNAKIVETVPEEVTNAGGEMMHSITVKVEIPSLTESKPSLLMRVKFLVSEKITGPLLQAAHRTVDGILAKTRLRGLALTRQGMSKDAIAAHILAGIKNDLNKASIPGVGSLDFEIHINSDFGDFYVAEQIKHATEYAG